MNPIDIARVAHEVNRAYCQSIGDHSQLPWEDAPSWQHQSAVDGVAFHLSNPEAGPEAAHENWREEKRRAGWVYGPAKDEHKREHPCMVQFHELHSQQQAKDVLFRAVVHALIPYLPPRPAAHAKLPNQRVTTQP